MKYRCPICKKSIRKPSKKHPEEAKFFPFCSERCKLMDLGAWFDAEYKVISKHPEDTSENCREKQ